MNSDRRWMDYALRLGRRALGTTAKNPPVGCVIVKEGRVVGIGWTQAGGRPHAEAVALATAGEGARGATAYVTLEPCSHHGRTPPCAEALVRAGIARVVASIEDPDPRVSGRGIAHLRDAGIDVDIGHGAGEARRILAGFLTRIVKHRPQVILKLAVSADGKISSGPGLRTAITGPEVWARVHLMRAECDAILIGMDTVLADNPSLACRLPGMEQRSPKPFVLSRGRDLPPGSKLAARGAEILRRPISEALADLGRRGINRLMVEGGARTARAFLEAGVVDEFHLFKASRQLGPAGVDALAGLRLDTALSCFRLVEEEVLGDDRLSVYVPSPQGEGRSCLPAS